MAAVDPTYPLYPIASFLASSMLLLVLLTSFVRQRWNFGVALLCFWLFFENLTNYKRAFQKNLHAEEKRLFSCHVLRISKHSTEQYKVGGHDYMLQKDVALFDMLGVRIELTTSGLPVGDGHIEI